MSARNCEDDLKMTLGIRVAPKSNEWYSYKERDRNNIHREEFETEAEIKVM